MNPYRRPRSLIRVAARAGVAVACGVAATLNVAAADDGRVMGRLAVSLGSGDWGFGLVAETESRDQRTGERGAMLQPRADLTARFSGSSGRFEGLSFNGVPVVTPAPVLRVDGAESTDAGVRWGYVALGVMGAAVVALAIGDALSDDVADALTEGIEEAAEN